MNNSMDFYICKNCKKPFSYYKEYPFCNKCDDLIFGKIKDFLEEHKGANEFGIELYTGIPVSVVRIYIREGRLDKYIDTSKKCKGGCGAILEDGQEMCPECIKRLKTRNEFLNIMNRNERVESTLNSHGFHSSLGKRK